MRGTILKAALATTLATIGMGGMLSAPVAAQNFSEGYEFLKAVKDRDGEVVTDFLDQPGSVIVNTRDISNGRTAMHIVTERRDLTWMRFLKTKGANVDMADKNGVTPLMIASNLGFVEGVAMLVNAGASVDQTNASGETPLIAAIHRRDVPMIRILLDSGASPDRNDNSGRSARDYAELMVGGRQVMEEIAKADEKRAGKGSQQTYGPNF